jgi:hypothetical protein
VCKPEIIVLSITATAVIPKAKICTAINEFRAMDTGTHRVSIIPKHGWKSGNPATFPYIHGHLAKRVYMARSILAIWLGEWGNCLGRDRSGCWIGPKCTTWQNKTLAYTPVGPNQH